MLAEDGGQFLTQRLAIGDAVLVTGKARVGAEFRLADFLGEAAGKASPLPTPMKILSVRVW